MRKIIAAGPIWLGVIAIGAAACAGPGAATQAGGSSSASGAPAQVTATAQPAATSTPRPASPTALPTATAPAATTAPATATAPAAAPASPSASGSQATASQGQKTYVIRQENSTARYVIDEVLRGSPFTVNGATNQISGQIVADPANPGSARIGTITIDARTFATDNRQRDRAAQNWVLETSKYPEITFAPQEIKGLPATSSIGQTYPIQIVGDLTVHGVTRRETFDATLTMESADRLSGKAQTTIRYADYGINIPKVPMVSAIAETVRLELDFVATTS